MRKYLLGPFLVLALIITPVVSQAANLADLQALILKLQAQIAVLQQQQTQQRGAVCPFSNDLTLGDGENDGLDGEISALHKILISGGYLNIPKPTGWFGKLTSSAVRNWQIREGLPVTGVIGPNDRSVLCGGASTTPISDGSPAATDTTSTTSQAPRITSVTYVTGKDTAVIRGYNLQAARVYFKGSLISKENHTYWTSDQISFVLPTYNSGTYPVYVTSTYGQSNTVYLTIGSTVTAQAPTATIDVGSLTSSSVYPVITGSAYNAPNVGISLSKNGEKYWGSGAVSVVSNRWTIPITIALSAGSYTVDVYSNNVLLASGGLNISAQAPTCVLTSNRSSYSLGENILFSWTSKNTNYASWQQDFSGKDTLSLPSDKLSANGSQYVLANVIGNPTVTLLVGGYYGIGSCTKTISIVSQ